MRKPKMKAVSTFQVDGDNSNYLVTLEPLKNTTYGNPRFKAIVIDLNNWNLCGWTYEFVGHYYGYNGEAEWVVKHHENILANA